MEPIAIMSFSENTYGPPDPSIILPSDQKKKGISVWNNQNKIKRLSKIDVSLDLVLFAVFAVVKSQLTKS